MDVADAPQVFFRIEEWKDGCWPTRELREAGYSAYEMKRQGYAAAELRKVSFTRAPHTPLCIHALFAR